MSSEQLDLSSADARKLLASELTSFFRSKGIKGADFATRHGLSIDALRSAVRDDFAGRHGRDKLTKIVKAIGACMGSQTLALHLKLVDLICQPHEAAAKVELNMYPRMTRITTSNTQTRNVMHK